MSSLYLVKQRHMHIQKEVMSKNVISLKYSDKASRGVIWMQARCQRKWSPDMKQVLMSQGSYKVTRKQ